VKGDVGDVSEPGAGSGRPEVMFWWGAACEEGALLVKLLWAGLRGTAWGVPVPGAASPRQGLSEGPFPEAELEPAMMSMAQGKGSACAGRRGPEQALPLPQLAACGTRCFSFSAL